MANEKRLVRSRTDKMVGGVCGGIGDYFNIDPTLVRVVFAILVLIGVGSPLLLYLLLWIIMPAADGPRPCCGRRWEWAPTSPLSRSPQPAQRMRRSQVRCRTNRQAGRSIQN
ncbi:MAG: PspC domain-containing protein [Caldilineaceae bacterium]